MHLGPCVQSPLAWKYAWYLLHCDILFCFWRGGSIWNLTFYRYSIWCILLMLAAGSISKMKMNSHEGYPVSLCLIFRKFLICAPLNQFLLSPIPAALSGVDFWLQLCMHVVTQVGVNGITLFSLLVCLLLFLIFQFVWHYLYCVVAEYFQSVVWSAYYLFNCSRWSLHVRNSWDK
jgi:hypothetical protein